jgi:hypothetical protein
VLTRALAPWALLLSLVSLVLSIAVGSFLLLRLPADYFVSPQQPHRKSGAGALLWVVGRNLVGWFVILLGVVCSIPGVPGQGILMILAGLTLVDVPHKFRVLRAVVTRPGWLSRINRLRERFGKPPFIAPHD